MNEDYPECSGNPASCPENEGYGCCKSNPTHPPIDSRAEFEAWCKRDKWSCDKDQFGNYLHPASSRYAAWQAARMHYAQPTPDSAIALLREIRDTTPITTQRKRNDAFLADHSSSDAIPCGTNIESEPGIYHEHICSCCLKKLMPNPSNDTNSPVSIHLGEDVNKPSEISVVSELEMLKTGIDSPYQNGWDHGLSEAILRIGKNGTSDDTARRLLIELRGWIDEDRYKKGSERYKNALLAAEKIREYLSRSIKPVLVDLQKCANAAHDVLYGVKHPDVPASEAYHQVAKAVLEAAGVKYVD